MRRLYPVLLLSFWLTGPAAAEEAKKKDAGPEPKEHIVTTKHSITIGGRKLDYEAKAGTLILRDDKGKARASMFFVAYHLITDTPAERRPVTFAFNGGPGSSSVWLHLGVLGPKRVKLNEKGKTLAPPYKLVANEATPLPITDLVFIDPVTTGFSRAAPGQETKQFHGVREDIVANGDFIRLWVTKFRRWDSPKFLIGESYGTTRAAGLVQHLQEEEGMNFNGVVLVSAVLNFGTLRFAEGNDLPCILFLPGYTATAWYHKKLPSDLQADRKKALAEAEKFAVGPYATALLKGDELPAAERKQVARQLARLTGLSEEYIERSNLRIDTSRFRKELLRESGKTVGRFDSRFTGSDLDDVGERPDYDPSYAIVQGPFTALVNRYLRTELNYETELNYHILTGKVHPWNYGSAKNRYLNVAPDLRRAMTRNPGLRVFVASGLYDLATPYYASRYTVSHLGLPPELRDHVQVIEYPAGHMMYINQESLDKLKKDMIDFLRISSAEKAARGR